ncbi:hypothetical protein HYFRA_00002702 [Hymenoscyphus fraxineus]|uniref:Uncharacterized protein n=1 Tax=Hymenoscyphus fraxineus TaxID=746836 RepID=A0A9N9PNR4_9HELO|nr:hypothetical protein HYFRA_00002702 [Hymenoscyphus fraxineus]
MALNIKHWRKLFDAGISTVSTQLIHSETAGHTLTPFAAWPTDFEILDRPGEKVRSLLSFPHKSPGPEKSSAEFGDIQDEMYVMQSDRYHVVGCGVCRRRWVY